MPLVSSSTSSPSAGIIPADELLLLCAEDSATFAEDPTPTEAAELCDEGESVDLELVESGNSIEWSGHAAPSVDADSRRRSVDWVLKVCSYYDFHPLTAYLAINYLDRFLSCHSIPRQSEEWPMQLLSVACLSLAAKLEETQVPALLDLQVEDAKFVFESQTVCRMEILVLSALNWRLRCLTPFSFLNHFARKADPLQPMTMKLLIKRASMVILDILRDVEFLDYHPSTIAASSVIFASNEAPNQPCVGPDIACSWCPGLVKDEIANCYQLMLGSTSTNGKGRTKLRTQKSLRVGTTANKSCETSSSSPSSPVHKRRKLNNHVLVECDNHEP